MKHLSAVAAILGGLLLFVGNGDGGGNTTVDDAFATYRALWIEHNLSVAAKLRSGELTTDNETRQLLAAGQEPMRRVAFSKIAKKEAEELKEWTAEKHASILEGYAK